MTLVNQDKSVRGTWTRAISVRGQTVVPKNIRDYLNLETGDSLEWSVNKNGEVVVQPRKKNSIMDSYGILKPKRRVENIEQAIRESKANLAKKKHLEGRL